MGIREIEKPVNQWCPHCNPKKGCTIYHERPQSCQDFSCLWLLGALPDDWKPDRIRTVFWTDDDDTLVMHEDPMVESIRLKEPFTTALNLMLEAGAVIHVIRGEGRKFLGDIQTLVDRLRKKGANDELIEYIVNEQNLSKIKEIK